MNVPDENSLIIKQPADVSSPTPSRQPLITLIEVKRQELIQLLRQAPAFLDVVKTLSEGKIYKAYIPPEVLKQIRDGSARLVKRRDTGFFGAHIIDTETGKIIHNISLVEVPPDLLNSLNQLAVQQTLADIVQRLEDLDEKMTEVLQGQLNDRLADVESGTDIYEQAMAASNPGIQQGLLLHAIQKLNDGRTRLIESMDLHFLDKLPRTRVGMFFYPKWNIPDYVRSKSEPVWKAAHAIVRSSRYLVMAYACLDQIETLRVSLEQVENEVQTFQVKMGEIVHWLSPTDNWRDSMNAIVQGALPSAHELLDIPQHALVVEFQPQEIAPPEGI